MSGSCVYTQECTRIAASGGGALAIDATYAYVAGTTSLWRVPLAGGAIETLATACTSLPSCYVPPPPAPEIGIVVDAASVYFTAHDGSLRKISKTGGASSAVTSGPFAVGAVDSTFAYGVDESGSVPSIAKVPNGGGTPVPLYTPSSTMSTPQPPGVDATNVYWVENDLSAFPPVRAVKSVPIAGGTPTTLASTTNTSATWYALFVQGGQVFWWQAWGSESTITLLGMPTGGSSPFSYGPQNVFSGSGDDVSGPAFDGVDVYMAVSRQSPDPAANPRPLQQVLTGPIDGASTTFASGSLGGTIIGGIAVDACNVYWVTDKSLVRRAK